MKNINHKYLRFIMMSKVIMIISNRFESKNLGIGGNEEVMEKLVIDRCDLSTGHIFAE